MSESFKVRVRADTRRAILQMLMEDTQYSINHEILVMGLGRYSAISMSDDECLAHLAWLEDAGLVTTEKLGRLMVGTLTADGLRVVQGHKIVAGVSRPDPL